MDRLDVAGLSHAFGGAIALAFHVEQARATSDIDVDLLGRPVRILTATHLTVFKALFDRTKDWADIEAMLVHGTVDVARVRGWLGVLVGNDDDRLLRLTQAERATTRTTAPSFGSLLKPGE